MAPPSWLPDVLQPVFTRVTTLSPGVALAAGAAAILFGGAAWRAVKIGAALALGVWAGFAARPAIGSDALAIVLAIGVGVGLAVLFHLVEIAAFAAIGGAVGQQLAGWGWPLLHQGATTDLVLLVGGLVGAVVAVAARARAIQVLSALAGGALVAWALGFPGHPLLILGLAAFGVWFQRRGGGKARRAKE